MDQAVRGRRPLYRSCRAAIERLNSKARFVYGRRAVILKRVILKRVISGCMIKSRARRRRSLLCHRP